MIFGFIIDEHNKTIIIHLMFVIFFARRNKMKKGYLWLILLIIIYLMNIMNVPTIIINILLVITTSLYMSFLWKKNRESNIEVALIILGFMVRIATCLLDIYGTELLTIPFSGDDTMHFYNTSVAYYHGDFSRVYTNYPYIINAIYQIVGLNRFAAQYVNILCWCFCALIMQKSCTLLKIEKNLRIIAIGLLAFMPFHICISSILMRDMLVAFSIMLTTYLIMKWMRDGKYLHLLVGVLISASAILLHNCVLAVLAVLAIMAACFSPGKEKFCIEKKGIAICILGFVGVAVLVLVPSVRNVVLSQFPSVEDGIFAAINGRLKYFYTNTGGSTYLLDVYVNNYWDLIIGTLQRMGYFLFSPVPWMWRGLSDIAGFLISVSVVIVSLAMMLVSFIYKKKDSFRALLIAIIFFVSGIFAWAVSNGWTALRHREKILGVLILLGVYSVQIIINAIRERKNA